jgi:hypothetical protein
VEICENQIVSRFVHSLVNAHDGKSLENILTVARDWPKEEPPGRIDRIMEKLVDAISAHDLDRVERLDKVKSGLEIVMEKVSGSWNALKEMFKTTSTKLKELEGVRDDTIAEITQFRWAFLEIEKMLDKDSGSSEKLSVDAFMDVVKEMDDKMSNAIALGTKLIESKILKDASKRKEDILTELKEGKGTHIFPNGDKYTGDFVADARTGSGTYTWANGDSYTGEYADGEWNGTGTYHSTTGYTYNGNFSNGKRNGYGKATWENGATYEGYWKNDLRDGEGKYTWGNGDVYEGNWKDDKMNGEGIIRQTNGNKYRGPFVNGLEEGMGLAEDKEGLRYEGNFTAGKRNGLFTVKDSSGNVIRTCEYIMGQIKPEKPIEEPKKKTTTKSKKRRR